MLKELEDALKKAKRALKSVQAIAALPPAKGSTIQWTHNKAIWIRVGDDSWTPLHRTRDAKYDSAHIASFDWEVYTGEITTP